MSVGYTLCAIISNTNVPGLRIILLFDVFKGLILNTGIPGWKSVPMEQHLKVLLRPDLSALTILFGVAMEIFGSVRQRILLDHEQI